MKKQDVLTKKEREFLLGVELSRVLDKMDAARLAARKWDKNDTLAVSIATLGLRLANLLWKSVV